MQTNNKLIAAKRAANDEFYTRYSDIELELENYADQFEGKNIYMPCDDPSMSQFWRYFHTNFTRLKLSSITASFKSVKFNHFGSFAHLPGVFKYCGGDDLNISAVRFNMPFLYGASANGDFRSSDYFIQRAYNDADIIVTNPPFSLFSEFLDYLGNKDFLIIGPKTAINYEIIFNGIKSNKINIGYYSPRGFDVPDSSTNKDMHNMTYWYTTLDVKEKPKITLSKHYNAKDYPKYDNIAAIEVSRVVDIPNDYTGVMGVPITFINKFNRQQFKLIDKSNAKINGKSLYKRLLIQRIDLPVDPNHA